MNNYIVYKHTSPSGKVYIGITSKVPRKRWSNGNGYLNNDYFTKAIKKYGWNNFKHEILYIGLSKAEAEQKEIELIAFYKSDKNDYGYNIQHGGSSVGKHSEETKIKIGIANKGTMPWDYVKHHSKETREKISKNHFGIKPNEETRLKMSLAKKGKKKDREIIEKIRIANTGKKRTIEQRKRIGASQKGKIVIHNEETKKKISKTMGKPVLCIETNIIYYGTREAERQTGIRCSGICECCNGKLKTAGGYHWKYVVQTI